jgi:hypothetical protein
MGAIIFTLAGLAIAWVMLARMQGNAALKAVFVAAYVVAFPASVWLCLAFLVFPFAIGLFQGFKEALRDWR